MKKGIFNNIIFRLLFPPFYGSLVYIMLLLVFDNIDQLFVNFFTREIAICIVLTYLLSESQRIGFFMLNKVYPLDKNLIIRILLQMLFGIISSLILISISLYIYFVAFIGYSSFGVELISFNILFGISSVFFNLLYFSIFLFNKRNEEEISKEESNKMNIEYKMLALKNYVNPDFLYNSLESLITILKKKPGKAENFIERFSDIYRYKLSNRNTDLCFLENEIKTIEDYIFLSSYRFSGKISMKNKLGKNLLKKSLIPCSLLVIMEEVVERSNISDIQPLLLELYSEEDNYINLKYENIRSLDPLIGQREALESMKKAYTFFSDKQLDLIEDGDYEIIRIPLLTIN